MKNRGLVSNFKYLPVAFSLIAVILSIVLVIFFKPLRESVNESDLTVSEVEIGNVTDSSFAVLFKTTRENASFLEYGVLGSFNTRAYPKEKGDRINHLVIVSSLLPSAEYNFRIISERGKQISEEKIIKTGSSLAFPPSQPFFGVLLDSSGIPISNSYLLIDLYGKDSETPSKIITFTETNGSFTFNTGSVRTSDLSAYAFPTISAVGRIDINGKTDIGEFSFNFDPPFTKFSMGTVNLGELKTDFKIISKKAEGAIPNFLFKAGATYAANSISYSFPSPGRWDLAIYSPITTAIGASEFLSKLNTGCAVDGYWLDQLENGAWESFILKDGVGYGRSFPIIYTKAYFVVVAKSVNSCSFEI